MIFEVYIPRIINNFYIYSNILGIINYSWVGKRETYFQNTSPRLLLYFYSCFVSRTSWLFFFTKKKKTEEKGKNSHFISKLLSIVLECVADFLQDFERNLNISSGSRDIGSRNSRTDTSPTSAFVPCSCVSRERKKKERKRGEGTKNREEKKKNRSSCDILADLYHVSLKNSRVSREFTSKVLFYSIYSFSFHSKLNNRMRKNSANCRIKKKHVIFLYRE